MMTVPNFRSHATAVAGVVQLIMLRKAVSCCIMFSHYSYHHDNIASLSCLVSMFISFNFQSCINHNKDVDVQVKNCQVTLLFMFYQFYSWELFGFLSALMPNLFC